MVEVGKIGSKRLEYLDLANKNMTSRDFQSAQSMIENFLTTIPKGDKVSDLIKKEFDQLEKKRIDTWENIMDNTKHMDAWTQSETRAEQRIMLSLEVLREKIDICWSIANLNGLFNE